MTRSNFKITISACFFGYITQAIMINFPPLLFLFFKESLGISDLQLSVLIASNFVLELLIDAVVSKYADKIGYRLLMIVANSFAILGLITMATVTLVLPQDLVFYGLMVSMALCGIGGGLMEVLVSPIVEACPTKNKAGFMSLLHSFYCWGQLGVVLLSTLFFQLIDIKNWYYAAFFWTIVPILGIILFIFAPINKLVEDGKGASLGQLLKNKTFWIFLIMMLCAGASELTMSQWASYFAESAVGVKWLGDLLGPCLFALAMALTRTFFAKKCEKINLDKALFISSLICAGTYVLTIVSNNPVFSLVGCACCGFGCGIMWPASFSLVSSKIPNGGVMMFGILALMGDAGCLVGPSLAGSASEAFGGIRYGFAFAIIFPVMMAVMSAILMLQRKKAKSNK